MFVDKWLQSHKIICVLITFLELDVIYELASLLNPSQLPMYFWTETLKGRHWVWGRQFQLSVSLLTNVSRFRRAYWRVDNWYNLFNVVHQHDSSATTLVARLNNPNIQSAVKCILWPKHFHLVKHPSRGVSVSFQGSKSVVLHLKLWVLVRK